MSVGNRLLPMLLRTVRSSSKYLSSMTVKRSISPFGRWESPISVDLLTGSSTTISDFQAHGKNDLYYIESRPFEEGRSVIVKMDGEGNKSDVVPRSANVRTKVHEYGGGEFIVDTTALNRGLVYSEFKDSGLYHIKDLKEPVAKAITPDGAPLRFADCHFHPSLPVIITVCEDHSVDTPSAVLNYLQLINFETKDFKTLVRGADFYSYPTFSRDGTKLIWKEWMHPAMPWTSSKLFMADFDAEALAISNVRQVAGTSKGKDFAITQPQFTSDGTLLFCSDSSGYQQLNKSVSPYETVSPLTESIKGDSAGTDWQFGNRTYTVIEDRNEVITKYTSPAGLTLLARIDLGTGKLQSINHPFLTIDSIQGNPAFPELLYITGSTKAVKGLFSFYASNGDLKVLKSSLPPDSSVDENYMSIPEAIEVKKSDGTSTFGFYYAPTSPVYQGPKGALPPLLLRAHGGPTSFAAPIASVQISYWTSRGYAFFASNYSGSSGFGRAYIQALDSKWGELDTTDVIESAKYLAAQGLCDSAKIAIDGGSAGGFTVLNALCADSTTFSAGCSLYGISELTALAKDTHKFESEYMFSLIGGTPEEIPEVYRSRSALYNAHKIKTPVMVQQGRKDMVVPIGQAEGMVKEIEKSGGVVEFLVFDNEGHGFRGADSQRESLLSETRFFEKYLKL